MNRKRSIGAVLCLALLAMAGCGNKSSDAPAPPVSQPTSTTSVTGVAMKGPIKAGTINVFAIRSGVTDTSAPIGQAQTDANGKYTVQTFGYSGPVMVEVTGGSYKDEISGNTVTLKTPLRAMFSSAGTRTTTMAVTPLSELAAKMADGNGELTADVIDASNRNVGFFFQITSIVTSLPSSLPDATDDQKKYASSLGAFSQLVIDSMRTGDWAAGQTMDDALATVMTTLGNEMGQTGGFSTASVAKINLAQTLFSSGGTTTPPPVTPPPPGPAGGVVKFGTAGTTTDIITSVSMTVTLPPGVTVDVAPGTNIAANISVLATPLARAETLSAFVTQATLTIPGKIVIQAQAPRGLALGQFLTVNFKIDPAATTFPSAASDFSLTGVAVQGKVGTLTGIITVSPLSLVVI